MKKLIPLTALAILILGCKKNYDCNCTYYDGTEDVSESYEIGKVKEDDAKTYCTDQVKSLSDKGATDITCKVEEGS